MLATNAQFRGISDLYISIVGLKESYNPKMDYSSKSGEMETIRF